jgi:lysophospholipase L1-like esterase
MGDSITYGQHIDPTLRWSSLLHAHYDKHFRDSDIHVNVINRGISGETTRMGLERYPADVQNSYPDILTIQFGLNDCNCWISDRGAPRVSAAAYRANLVEMIDRARRFGCRHIICSTNHVTLRRKPMLSGERYEEANARYSGILRSVAAETGVMLCDIRSAFEPFSDEELDRMLLPYPDHLHLSIEGNQVYFQTIFPYVDGEVKQLLRADPQGERTGTSGPVLPGLARAA